MQNSSTKNRPSLLIAFLLFVIPLIAYCSQLGRWAIDCDEFYTYFDSSLPISKLLEWETKPIYYIVCHFLLKLDLGLPLEVVLRLPSAICSSLIPVTAYWMLWSPERNRMALFTALLFLINPWIFGFAVTARFYGVVTWLSLIAIVALWRWIETSKTSWICTFGIVTLIATGVHTTAGVLFPAGAIAAFAASMSRDPKLLWQRMRAWAPIFAVASLLMLGSAYWVLHKQIDYWLNSDSGTFGSYSILQIAVAVLLNVGITVFSLAVLPLIRPLRSWNAEDIFLTVIVVSGV